MNEEETTSKRTNGTTLATQASTEITKLSMPEKAPLWAKNSLDLFQRNSPPPEFMALVQKWIDFEQTKKWASKGKFGAINRPQAVHDWICALA